MSTFTALALDRLIEPGGAKTMTISRDSRGPNYRRNSLPESGKDRRAHSPSTKLERGISVTSKPELGRGVSVPPSTKLVKEVFIAPVKLDRSHSASAGEKKHHWTQISPALYATPEPTPLPDSPSSFPPSPYIINHKRRGPRLMKSLSDEDVATHKPDSDEKSSVTGKGVVGASKDDTCNPEEVLGPIVDASINSSSPGDAKEKCMNGSVNNDHGSSDMQSGMLHMQFGCEGRNGVLNSLKLNLPPNREIDDEFIGPQESRSVKSVGGSEGKGTGWEERQLNSMTPLAEFYDAWEELSSGSGSHPQDIETELREIRLSLLMEIEKRKLVEDTLHNMRTQWQRLCQKLSTVGLTLPVDPTTLSEGKRPSDLASDLSQQVYLARFVANSIGRGIAKAEVEKEMEDQIKGKNFEIARLWDRLRYYEAVNQEMSQRNQEVVETARQLRQRRKRREKWLWTSIAAAVSIGSAALAYSYFHSEKGSSSQASSHDPGVNHKTN